MTTHTPQYRIQLRDNTLTPLGELPDFIDGDVLLNFNDVGAFVLTVRADSPMASHFAAGNGVIISRDRGDGSGAETILSGPIWHLERRLKDNTYVLSGPDDLWWLKARRADPVTVAGNYSPAVNALSGLLRYYKLGESSGTTATDSKSAINGTYSGGFTLGQSPLVDDPATSVLFNGSTGQMAAATTGLPSGASAWWMLAWVQLTSTPAAFAGVCSFGTNGANTAAELGFNASGQPYVGISGNAASTITGAVLSNGVPHLLAAGYDGTNTWLSIDGAPSTLATPSAGVNIGTTSANVGRLLGGSFLQGTVQQAAFGGGARLSDTTLAALYALGVSRYAQSAYDTRTATASTVIRQYVDVNAAGSALLPRRVFGLTLAADPAIGTSVTGNERFDNLLAACQQLALSGGDIGFRLVQTDVGTLTFTIYQPATQSNAIFSRELGNLLDATYTLDGPVANQYVIAGGGDGTLRICQTAQDGTSVSTWGMVEGFIDSRDTSDLPTLQQRLSAQLAQDAQQTNLSITPTDTAALTFGRDYNLGDVVSVQIDDTTITDIIRQLHIQLNSSDQELVTPGIGNAGAGQIAALFDAKQRALAAVQKQLTRLQTAQ